MQGILLIDHGSRVLEANRTLEELAGLVRSRAGDAVVVAHAHMELASPSIEEAVEALVERGVSDLVAVPCMLAPGRHATHDIPRIVGEAAARCGISARISGPLGAHDLLAELVIVRAGLPPRV
ncbi:MAG: hypothetical protein KC417_13255 [Myxococcales bacterium]|nr:hypothetical protein [Myxococcales bacterium]